jgi:hypothetical protein
LGVIKAKISLQSSKTEFGAQNQHGRVIHPSIGNFSSSKKKHTFGGQKGENTPPEPKNGTKAPKNQKKNFRAIKIKTKHFKICFWPHLKICKGSTFFNEIVLCNTKMTYFATSYSAHLSLHYNSALFYLLHFNIYFI